MNTKNVRINWVVYEKSPDIRYNLILNYSFPCTVLHIMKVQTVLYGT